MRIIGGSDYYDSGMAFGHDDHVVFVREKDRDLTEAHALKLGLGDRTVRFRVTDVASGVPVTQVAHSRLSQWTWRHGACDLTRVAAVVCGKRYDGLVFEAQGGERQVVWSLEGLRDWADKRGLVVEDGGAPKMFDHDWLLSHTQRVRLEDYFGPTALPAKAMDFLLAERVTLMTREPGQQWSEKERGYVPNPWRVNAATLKGLQFYKVLDAYTLFQEIEMWVGGVLPAPGHRAVEITDDTVKVAKHGFDPKWSFRQPPAAAR